MAKENWRIWLLRVLRRKHTVGSARRLLKKTTEGVEKQQKLLKTAKAATGPNKKQLVKTAKDKLKTAKEAAETANQKMNLANNVSTFEKIAGSNKTLVAGGTAVVATDLATGGHGTSMVLNGTSEVVSRTANVVGDVVEKKTREAFGIETTNSDGTNKPGLLSGHWGKVAGVGGAIAAGIAAYWTVSSVLGSFAGKVAFAAAAIPILYQTFKGTLSGFFGQSAGEERQQGDPSVSQKLSEPLKLGLPPSQPSSLPTHNAGGWSLPSLGGS